MPFMPVPVVTVREMQSLEAASSRRGVGADTLMENAGLACAGHIRGRLGGAAGRRVLVLVGPGNNGADGLVTARRLRRWGAEVCCYVVRGRPDPDPKMADALADDVPVAAAADDPRFSRLEALLGSSGVVVDAILGAGRYRPLAGPVAEVAARVNEARHAGKFRTVALDIPTGVNPDTGEVDLETIEADETLALHCPKAGIANFPGAGFAGDITVLDIGLPAQRPTDTQLNCEWMTAAAARELLPPRLLTSHKGDFGHLLIVAGSRHYIGAAYLAAQGAHRVGTGLVTLATPESVYRMAAVKLTETIHLPLPEDAEGRIRPTAVADELRHHIGVYSALAVGCGIGWSAGTTQVIDRLLLNSVGVPSLPSLPAVIDADGLNNLSDCPDWPARLSRASILTPHPGEMSRLTGETAGRVQSDRLAAAGGAAAEWQQTVLLKGAYSIVAAADGRKRVLPFANPALAAGGTGDLLTGIIGGLLAQGLAAYDAAALGGYIHGLAAGEVRRRHGDTGIVASDLLECMPDVMASLQAQDG